MQPTSELVTFIGMCKLHPSKPQNNASTTNQDPIPKSMLEYGNASLITRLARDDRRSAPGLLWTDYGRREAAT